MVEIERFDTKLVARDYEFRILSIQYGYTEHAVQTCENVLTPFQVTRGDDFCVTCCREAVSFGCQFVAQLPVVEYRAIENEGDLSV